MQSLEYENYSIFLNCTMKSNPLCIWISKCLINLIGHWFILRLRTQNGIWVKIVSKSFIYYMYMHHKKKLKFLHWQKRSFLYWICSFGKNPPFYEVKKIFWKRLCAWRDFKNIFSRPLFTIIFRPKILILGTYSILST